mmetsp:Transcript_48393/g.121158  ORF Transcript_48393/g.121158 Transcript_48393/m.121158 type:complete len:300 (-) Transcript_48393:394-1293(-)
MDCQSNGQTTSPLSMESRDLGVADVACGDAFRCMAASPSWVAVLSRLPWWRATGSMHAYATARKQAALGPGEAAAWTRSERQRMTSPAAARTRRGASPAASSCSNSPSVSGTHSLRPRYVPEVSCECRRWLPGQHMKQPASGSAVWSNNEVELCKQCSPTWVAGWSKCSPALRCEGAPQTKGRRPAAGCSPPAVGRWNVNPSLLQCSSRRPNRGSNTRSARASRSAENSHPAPNDWNMSGKERHPLCGHGSVSAPPGVGYQVPGSPRRTAPPDTASTSSHSRPTSAAHSEGLNTPGRST